MISIYYSSQPGVSNSTSITIVDTTVDKDRILDSDFKNLIQFNVSVYVPQSVNYKLTSPKQFDILIEFITHKGHGFKNKLFGHYLDALEIIKVTKTHKFEDTVKMLKPIVMDILDMFDTGELLPFIKDLYGLKPPPSLQESFNENDKANAMMNRDQTYTIQEYYELVTFVVIMKAVFPIIGELGFVKKKLMDKNLREYAMLTLISDHKIFEYTAVKKLYAMIGSIVDRANVDLKALVIERYITTDNLLDWLFIGVVLKRLSVAIPADDTAKSNIITAVYNYTDNRLKPSTSITGRSKFKKPIESDNTAAIDGDLYRQTTGIPIGIPELYSATFADVETFVQEKGLDPSIIEPANKLYKILLDNKEYVPLSSTIYILAVYCRDVLTNPEALLYCKLNDIKVALAVFLTDLKRISGYDTLISYILSVVTDKDINLINRSRNRIQANMVSHLAKYYRTYRETINMNLEVIDDESKSVLTHGDISKVLEGFVSLNLYSFDPSIEDEDDRLLSSPKSLKDEIIKFIEFGITNYK